MFRFLLPLVRNKENGSRKQNPDRLCTLHYDTGLFSADCKEKIAVDKAVFSSTVRDEFTRIKNAFVENIHSFSF